MQKIKALKRFNHHNPGDIFEASDADAKAWIEEKLAVAVENKDIDQPLQDKAKKQPEIKK